MLKKELQSVQEGTRIPQNDKESLDPEIVYSLREEAISRQLGRQQTLLVSQYCPRRALMWSGKTT
jgi:hypothetical protein